MEIDAFADCVFANSVNERGFINLTWTPFIGKEFSNAKNKLLLVGKSHYNWGSEDAERQLALMEFNIEAIIWNAFGTDRWKAERVPDFHKKRFHRSIERIFLKNRFGETERLRFWESVAFHQLIQTPMNNWVHKDDKTAIINGWILLLELMPILKPDTVIFFSSQWKYYSEFLTTAKSLDFEIDSEKTIWDKLGKSQVHCLTCSKDHHTFKICFTIHPSSRSSNSITQKAFFEKVVPDCIGQY